MVVSEGQLFEWELPAKRKQTQAAPPELVPRPPGYHAVTNSKGAQGFHRTKISAEMSKYGSVQTYCGIVGRRVPGVYPREIPLCEDCEREFAEK